MCETIVQLVLHESQHDKIVFVTFVSSRLDRIPQQILMENVQGFETSDAHLRFVSVLNKRGYRFKVTDQSGL